MLYSAAVQQTRLLASEFCFPKTNIATRELRFTSYSGMCCTDFMTDRAALGRAQHRPVLGGDMLEMVKGANVGLASLSEDVSSVVLSLAWGSAAGDGDADVSVLLLDANGKVRNDADF